MIVNIHSDERECSVSLNMYVGEVSEQTASMNTVCTEIIEAMEETQSSITSFLFAFNLKGKTYESAKAFMAKTYYPLAQGIIYLCKELMEQNKALPKDFNIQVAPTDVVENEVLDQIGEIDRMLDDMRATNEAVPLLNVSILIYEQMKQLLEVKLERLYTFNKSSKSNYETALLLAEQVSIGLAELNNGSGFNSASGTFSVEKMDLDWAMNVDKIYYEKKAYEQYGEYLEQFPKEIDTVIDIIKFEEANPEYVEQTNEFLSPLDQQFIVELKAIIYSAEEPHRTLGLKYLDRFEIVIITPEIREEKDTDSNGFFSHSDDAIYLEIGELRKDKRGNYYTYFHEVAHAFDYYYAQDNEDLLKEMVIDTDKEFDESTFFTDVFIIGEKVLTDHMYEDAGNHFRMELSKGLESSEYDHLNSEEKQDMIDHVVENLLAQNTLHRNLTVDEKQLQSIIEDLYEKDLLHGPDNNTASDVYGGVTNKVIEGNYNHEDGYWLNEDGTRKRDPNREGFAEYYARIMAPDGDEKPGINSIDEFLPISKYYMDEIFELMGRWSDLAKYDLLYFMYRYIFNSIRMP